MKTYEEVPLIQDSLQNLNSQSTPNVISPESQSDLERQSSTDTSNFESGSEGTSDRPEKLTYFKMFNYYKVMNINLNIIIIINIIVIIQIITSLA